ncbi:MAG: hypothetical protein ABH810_02525 [bacterium]|nr:hypothetical protein [Patescibacteria group bacterium]
MREYLILAAVVLFCIGCFLGAGVPVLGNIVAIMLCSGTGLILGGTVFGGSVCAALCAVAGGCLSPFLMF